MRPGLGIWRSGQNWDTNKSNKNVRIKIRVAQNVGKVLTSRKKQLRFKHFSMDQKNEEKKTPYEPMDQANISDAIRMSPNRFILGTGSWACTWWPGPGRGPGPCPGPPQHQMRGGKLAETSLAFI